MEFFWNGAGGPEGPRSQLPGVRLVLEELDFPGRRIEAPLGGGVTVGRDASVCQVVLTEASVARQQCRIYERDGRVMVCNLSRSNITEVDGLPVLEDRELPAAFALRLGRVRVRAELR